MNKDYDCPQIVPYVEEVRKLERKLKGLRFEHVMRKDNFAVDELAKMAAERRKPPAAVFYQKEAAPSVAPQPAAGDAPPAPKEPLQQQGSMPLT